MDRLLDTLENWEPFHALVIGDFMLDQLLAGDAERLSSDAPVPVLDVKSREEMPGGAANLCRDLVAMGGTVTALGVVGTDQESNLLRGALAKEGVDVTGLVADSTRPTTVKRNLIGLAQARHPQKMFRLDIESRDPISDSVIDALLAAIDRRLPNADVVCIEDYKKGVCSARLCQAVIGRARAAGKPVFVDPGNLDDYSKYRDATVITPNRTEAERATGLKTHADASAAYNARLAQKLKSDFGFEAVVLTLDRHGALLLEGDADPVAVPTVVREVYDVTGAGDMMLAGLAAARANGLGWADSVRFANAAAGLEVEIFGVAPIPLEQIHHEILVRHGRLEGKLRSLDQLLLEIKFRRQRGESIVFTNGVFDVLHAGHIRTLEAARSFGDFLVVGINADASVERLKGPERPINPAGDRATVLGALEAVGAVVIFDEDTPVETLERVRPDVHVKGADYAGKPIPERGVVESFGGRIELVELVPGKSTTETIGRLRAPAGAGERGGTPNAD